MKLTKIESLLKVIVEFTDNPSSLTFGNLKSDDTMVSMARVLNLENSVIWPNIESTADEEAARKVYRQLINSVKDDDMAMALLHAVQLRLAFELLVDRPPNNRIKNDE